MNDKYNTHFTWQAKSQDCQRLINQMWKLIPMRENNENWQDHLTVLLEEISGICKLYNDNVNALVLLSKLEGLTSKFCDDFMIYRKTVFSCINLLTKVFEDE